MCTHTHGHRFDPGMTAACCPVCGAITGAEAGQPTPGHQPVGSRDMCPGSGQPAV